jgi:hypothetical protein
VRRLLCKLGFHRWLQLPAVRPWDRLTHSCAVCGRAWGPPERLAWTDEQRERAYRENVARYQTVTAPSPEPK